MYEPESDTVADAVQAALDAEHALPQQAVIDHEGFGAAHEVLVVVDPGGHDDLVGELSAAPFLGAKYTPVDGDPRVTVVGKARADINARLAAASVPLELWTFPEDVSALDVVQQFASRGVHLNRTLLGAKKMTGPGGFGDPVAARVDGALPDATTVTHPGEPALAILDTGLPSKWSTWFPQLVGTVVPAGPANEIDDPAPVFEDTEDDHTVGHGLFIAGIVRQVAPTIAMSMRRVLRYRLADDAFLAAELAERTEPVINLSLIAICPDGTPAPPGMRAAIEKLLANGQVVVAAAGNKGTDSTVVTSYWPGSFKGVITVGALDSRTSPPSLPSDPAFSNYGPWVDVWAPGVGVRSTFLVGYPVDAPGGGSTPSDGWVTWHGTSFAAPIVAARIAQLVQDDELKRAPIEVAREFLAGLPSSTFPGYGKVFEPRIEPLLVEH